MADSGWTDILNSCNGVSPANFRSAEQLVELWQGAHLPVNPNVPTYSTLEKTQNSCTLINLPTIDHEQAMFAGSGSTQSIYGSPEESGGPMNTTAFSQFSNLLSLDQDTGPSTTTVPHPSESFEVQEPKTVRRTQTQRENHILAERQRREEMNEKFAVLRSFIPRPIKKDKASIVGETIEYVIEMERTLKQLRARKEERQCSRGPSKLRKSGASDLFQKLDISASKKLSESSSTQVDVEELGSQAVIKVLSKRKRGLVMQVHLALHDCKVDVLQSNVMTIGDKIVQFTTIEMNPGVSASISQMVDVLEQVSSPH